MSTIIQKLEASGYKLSSEELTQFLTLAKNAGKVSDAVDGGYFKILLVGTITNGGGKEGLKAAHEALYNKVKEVCIEPWMNAQERNRATNFARSAYSTLKKAINLGYLPNPGDTKKDVAEYTKAATTIISPLLSLPESDPTHQALQLVNKIKALLTEGADGSAIVAHFDHLIKGAK